MNMYNFYDIVFAFYLNNSAFLSTEVFRKLNIVVHQSFDGLLNLYPLHQVQFHLVMEKAEICISYEVM